MEGWHGWDEYARFYDWENRRTLGRRDVRFWRRLAERSGGRVLELGCGTGRVSVPVARTGVMLVGIDRSADMLRIARRRMQRARLDRPAHLVRGDIRALPFGSGDSFDLVVAPYGIVQSLVREADLTAALRSIARVTAPGGVFGIDLVPDVPRWQPHGRRVTLRGRGPRGTQVTLIEAVRQDVRRRLTTFDQQYVLDRPGGARVLRRFRLTFRTLSVPQMVRRIERVGFRVEAVLGGYDEGPWDARADVWVIVARRATDARR